MKTLPLFVCWIVGLITMPAFSQANDGASTTDVASTTVAYLYVQVAKGINVYDVSFAGKLTLVKGSPFATSGQLAGVTSTHLISVGTTNIHSYAVSGGVIGKQQSVINTQSYSGSECGATSYNGASNGAVLDHTGKFFYIQMYGAIEGQPEYNDPICADWQTYTIGSNGALGFLGDTQNSSEQSSCGINGWSGESTVPTISSNDKLAYAVFPITSCTYSYNQPSPLTANTQHVLEAAPNLTITGPVTTRTTQRFGITQ